MDLTNPNIIIIIASSVLIVSYLFSLVAKWTSIPSVLLLILLGMGTSGFLANYGITGDELMPLCRILGIIGLIMIVLEAAMDLLYRKINTL
jgi:NhaP-type Na+/H+ and K+/H+ antiporter